MNTTPNFNLPKPIDTADIDEEFYRLQVAWDTLDLILLSLATQIAGKSNLGHGHAIGDIVGLVAALADKMDADRTFSLDDLADVNGAAEAAINYVLVKAADGRWMPSSAIAALGPHQHAAGDIQGLTQALDAKLDDSQLDTDASLAANNDTKIASQKAIRTYIEAALGLKLNKTGDIITGPLTLAPPANNQPQITYTYKDVRQWITLVAGANDGRFYIWDASAGAAGFAVGLDGSIWCRQLGDINTRIENRGQAWANQAIANIMPTIAAQGAGAVGTYALLKGPSMDAGPGNGFSGGSLQWTNAAGNNLGTVGFGSWRLMGAIGTGSGTGPTSLFLRYA